jgi:hypothetical protein
VVSRQAEQIDGYDGLGFEPEALGGANRPAQTCRIDVEGRGIDIGEDGGCAQQGCHLGSRAEGESRAKDCVAAADSLGHQAEEERIGAARARYRMARAAKCRQRGFELAHLGTENELTMIDDAGDRRVDARPKPPALRGEIDERK